MTIITNTNNGSGTQKIGSQQQGMNPTTPQSSQPSRSSSSSQSSQSPKSNLSPRFAKDLQKMLVMQKTMDIVEIDWSKLVNAPNLSKPMLFLVYCMELFQSIGNKVEFNDDFISRFYFFLYQFFI